MVLEITSGLFPWNGIQKKCCVIVGILATALFFVLREPIIRLFISDGEVVYYGVKMLVAYMLSGPFIGILFVNYELHAVYWRCASGNDSVGAPTGTSVDSRYCIC